jgi:Peptidase A4 family
MQRSWPILIGTFLLVCGGVLTGVSPAAAASPRGGPASGPPGTMVRPGGPASRLPASAAGWPAGSATHTVVKSTNWSGYAATGANGHFTSVSSSWVEPTAKCSGFGDQYSAFWVGLDGYSSSTVEQTGSEADCDGSTAEYSAWYEMYPAYPVYFNNPVRAGDHFTGSVAYQSSTSTFTITLTDSTQKWTQTTNQALSGAVRSSAEVIAEAPSSGSTGNVLPLTNFGAVNFSGATVNGASLCSSSPVEIVMPEVSVSSISGCTGFGVTYTGGGGQLPWPYF